MFKSITLRAIEFARNGDFVRATDMLHDLEPRSQADEVDIDYAWRRVEQFETKARAAS